MKRLLILLLLLPLAAWAQPYPSKPIRIICAKFTPTTPEQFAAFVKSAIAKWAPVVKASGAKVD